MRFVWIWTDGQKDGQIGKAIFMSPSSISGVAGLGSIPELELELIAIPIPIPELELELELQAMELELFCRNWNWNCRIGIDPNTGGVQHAIPQNVAWQKDLVTMPSSHLNHQVC